MRHTTFATLFAATIVYGRFSQENELTACRASGVSTLSVLKPALFMGVVQPGQKVTKQLVVKGKKPFRILSVSCDDKSFRFDTSKQNTAKELHLIPVTFEAGVDAGKVVKTIRIKTDQGEMTPELAAYAVIAAVQ